MQRRRLADAVAQVAARRQRRHEVVIGEQAVERIGCVARRFENLAYLEGVIPRVTEHLKRGRGVVEHERVIPVSAIDANLSAEDSEVVHPLDVRVRDRLTIRVHLDSRHHARAEQEQIRLVGAVDPQLVVCHASRRFTHHVDQRRTLSRKPDFKPVAPRIAPHREFSRQAVLERLHTVLVVVDPDDIRAATRADQRHSTDPANVDHIVALTGDRHLIAREHAGRAGVCRFDVEIVRAAPKPEIEDFKARIGNAERHPQARQARRLEPSAVRGSICAVIDPENVRRTSLRQESQTAAQNLIQGA